MTFYLGYQDVTCILSTSKIYFHIYMIDSIIIQKLLVVTKFGWYLNLLEWNWVRICTICCHTFAFFFLFTVIVTQRPFSICKSTNLWNVFSFRKCFICQKIDTHFLRSRNYLPTIFLLLKYLLKQIFLLL